MYDIAVDVLTIPATSAPSEHVFSRTSYILDCKCRNLYDDKVQLELMFNMNQMFMNA
uniref:HAT C-terminal dimerisation domain-containing protein n=1 Tax=Romanomermis culicivorax TaxID=13658 RepID=A0A915L4G7_ROMCU